MHQPGLPADCRPISGSSSLYRSLCGPRQRRPPSTGRPLPVARWPVHQQRPRFPRPDHRPAVGRTDRRLAGQRTPATAPQRGRSLPSKPVCVASIDSGQGLTQMDGSPQILWELSLLAMAMCQPTWMPTDPPPSRASSAPTGSPIFEIPWQTIPPRAGL
ncbi:hypothetical protein EMIT0P228_160094 [Pseudomonas brassicacearum]